MHSLGPDWMDPQWLLERFGGQFFWVSAAIVFIECGLLFPILPGDSLLFAVGLFIAEGSIDINIGVACAILTASTHGSGACSSTVAMTSRVGLGVAREMSRSSLPTASPTATPRPMSSTVISWSEVFAG